MPQVDIINHDWFYNCKKLAHVEIPKTLKELWLGFLIDCPNIEEIYVPSGLQINGDIGTIENVDMEDRSLKVRFEERLVEYEDSELDELTLAYATTFFGY